MERLTERHWRNLDPWECCGQDYYCKRGCHDEGGCTKGCIVPRIYARLAAYEDTGLEPEEVEYSKLALMGKVVAEVEEFDGIPIKRLQELAQAEKDGRLVVLPCKPGQTIWVESCIRGRTTSIEAPDITWIIENTERFGQEIFLTREEAKAALKKREEADNAAD